MRRKRGPEPHPRETHNNVVSKLSSIVGARHLAVLGQQQHISSTTAFEQWIINRWDSCRSDFAKKAVIHDIFRPLNRVSAAALRLLAAEEPSGLLQQVRPAACGACLLLIREC
jgi:hypothetical protein